MRHLTFLAILLFPALLSAQTTTSPEIFVRAGLVKLWDDEGNLGTGPSFGGGAGIRLPIGIGIEVIAEHHNNDRDFSSGATFHSTATSVMGRVAKYVGASRTQPYFGGSLGVLQVRTVSQFPGQPTNDRTTTSAAFGGFTGVRFAAGRHVFVRPEFELSFAGEHFRMGGSVAAGYSW
ncbi:MAG: porin family protein [Vicinamibacterales bacterium]|nr:porin family protein [Vicinamibacterales bacterium]